MHSSSHSHYAAFTVIEMLIVMSIIIVLAGLVLATSGYVQKKGARARAETEIAAMSAALESYKADNGIYPTGPQNNTTDMFDAGVTWTRHRRLISTRVFSFSNELSGLNADQTPIRTRNRILPSSRRCSAELATQWQCQSCTFVRDPFGNSYGYSTAYQAATPPTGGYNPTFDLWSTANSNRPAAQWIKNW